MSSEPDNHRMEFDPEKAFHLEFGRGSGLTGLDTVAIDETGVAKMYRRNIGTQQWETADLKLSRSALRRLLEIIVDFEILQMKRGYSARVYDGTQWVFWLKQENQQKAIYFDNHFPYAIQRFAMQLDEELQKAGDTTAHWTAVPESEAGKHDKEIWSAVR